MQSAGEAAYFFTAAPSNTYVVKEAGGNKLRKGTAVDTYTDVTFVGHSYEKHTDLLMDGANTVIVCKEDIAYYIDGSDNDQDYLPEMRTSKSSTSGKNSLFAHGRVYIQCGDQTLWEHDGTAGTSTALKTNISPSLYMTELSDFSGKILGIAADDRYLIVILDNGSDIQILAGQWETIGTTDFRWHTLCKIISMGCATAIVSNHVKKRLWITSTAAGNSVYYVPFTTKYGDIVNDSDYKYQTGGYLVTPWIHGNLKGDEKAWIKLRATMGHTFNSGRYFNINYKLWGDSSYDATTIKMDGESGNMVETNFIDVSAKPTSPFIQFKITGITGTNTISPILERLEVFGIWRPTKRWIIECVVLCQTNPQFKNMGHDKITAKEIKEVLDEMADAKWPVTFNDLYGTEITVNVLPDGIKYTPMKLYKKTPGEFEVVNACTLTLQKVELT